MATDDDLTGEWQDSRQYILYWRLRFVGGDCRRRGVARHLGDGAGAGEQPVVVVKDVTCEHNWVGERLHTYVTVT
jgi:hypothetical protein